MASYHLTENKREFGVSDSNKSFGKKFSFQTIQA